MTPGRPSRSELGNQELLRMPQAWAGWVDWVPHGPGSWSQEHRWAAPARAFGWSAPVGARFLAPHLWLLRSRVLPAAQVPTGAIRRGLAGGVGTPGPCHLWRSQLEHLAAGRPTDAQAMLFSAPSAPTSALSRRSAMPSGIVPPWLERFLEHQKPCVLVHFHESPFPFIGSSNAAPEWQTRSFGWRCR